MTLRGTARRSIPYLVAIMSGFLLAYLIVAFFIFPAHLVTSDTKVPNVVGQPYEAAAAQLQKLGFTAQRGEQRFTAGAASGQVLGQNPSAGRSRASRNEGRARHQSGAAHDERAADRRDDAGSRRSSRCRTRGSRPAT